jgi:hypothetical protein
MLRLATLVTILTVLALPATAQQATPSDKADWSKPVVGVDAINGLTLKVQVPADEALPVEVYTLDDLKREIDAASAAVINSPQKQPPCDPERKPSADGKSEVLSVCPAQPLAPPPTKAQ